MQSSTARRELEYKAAAVLELQKRKSERNTVYGIVSPTQGLIKSLTKVNGEWVETNDTPDLFLAEKIEPVLKSKKRFIVLIGGRGSTKSVAVADICIADAKDTGAKTYFLREFQSSIKNSVHSLIKAEIERFKFTGFEALNNSITFNGEDSFEFAGLARNIDSVKSTHGFKRFAIEEAQFISQSSLDALTPTIRNAPKNGLPSKFLNDEMIEDIQTHPDIDNVSMMFIANPGSSADPFSKRFIEPFKKDLDRDGLYEDDLHLIVKINYDDNPWHEDSGLETERLWDYEYRSRAYYDHRWGGEYNDSVENSIIKPEWFDAALDAHKDKRLAKVFEPHGARIAAHDPSDEGKDDKGFALRHGSIIQIVKSMSTGEVDEGCDWACKLAIDNKADWFVWDGDGMGTGLKGQVSRNFNGKQVKYHMFRGSLSGSGQDNADKIYMPQSGDEDTTPKTYAETFKNNRSQYYTDLAIKFYNTFRCVTKGEYVDPDDMISLDTDGIDNIQGLRSELCRIPLKDKHNPNGLIQIMSKKDMKAIDIDSPNEADSVMMSLFMPPVEIQMAPLNYPKMSIV